MPAFYTHYHFAKKLYHQMDKTFQDSIDINYYLYFAQSFDILFYDYGLKKSNKLTKKVGHMGHYKNTQAFFLNTINLTKKSTNPIHLKYFKSFLYGFLTHYILDAKFHPYIFYKTGTFKKTLDTNKYNGLHTKIELLIDKYFYEQENNQKYHKAKLYKLYDNIEETNFLNQFIENVFYKTFYKKDIGKKYLKLHKKWRLVTKYAKNDPYKIKLLIYKIYDLCSPKLKTKIKYYSNAYEDNSYDFLNNKHNKWFNPADNNISSSSNIDDLFNESLKQGKKLFQQVEQLFDKDIRTLNFPIANISYFSGLDLHLNKKLKFFEF